MTTYKRKTKNGKIAIVKNNHQKRSQLKNPIPPAVRGNFYRSYVPYNPWESNLRPSQKKWREENNQLSKITYGAVAAGLGLSALAATRKNPFRNIKPIPAKTWRIEV